MHSLCQAHAHHMFALAHGSMLLLEWATGHKLACLQICQPGDGSRLLLVLCQPSGQVVVLRWMSVSYTVYVLEQNDASSRKSDFKTVDGDRAAGSSN